MFKKLFGPKKKLVTVALLSPVSGKSVSVTEIPDPMFSQKMLGDGVAIIPDSTHFYSPANGRITLMPNSYHVFGLTTEDETEVIIHIGLETIELHNEGFTSHITNGQQVHKGDLLFDIDIELIQAKGYNPIIAVLLPKAEALTNFKAHYGKVVESSSTIIEYEKEIILS